MSSGRPLGEEAKNGAGTLPAYKKITPEELDKYNIPATVQKYFGPRGPKSLRACGYGGEGLFWRGGE